MATSSSSSDNPAAGGVFPYPRKQWTAPDGYIEKHDAHYAEMIPWAAQGDALCLSHARRFDKQVTRTNIILDWLREEYKIRELPLYLAEYVPHDRTGYPIDKRHTVTEKETLTAVLQKYRDHILRHLEASTLLIVGEPAFEIVQLLLGDEAAKQVVRCAHPSVWNKPQEVINAYKAVQKLQIPSRDLDFDAFKSKVSELISSSWAVTNADPVVKTTRRLASRRIWGRPGHVKKFQKIASDSWKNPKIRAKRLAGQRAANKNPEVRKRRSEGGKARFDRPGEREAVSARSKEVAERPGESARRSEQRRDDWKKLSPEERRERGRQIKEGKAEKKKSLTPEELETRKKNNSRCALEREKAKRIRRQEALAAQPPYVPSPGFVATASETTFQIIEFRLHSVTNKGSHHSHTCNLRTFLHSGVAIEHGLVTEQDWDKDIRVDVAKFKEFLKKFIKKEVAVTKRGHTDVLNKIYKKQEQIFLFEEEVSAEVSASSSSQI